ncbi:MAG TPA: formate dehydrogenase accessory protein FdhE [Chloroflexota bacterium]
MSATPAERLAELARADPPVAPLALLQAEALRAAAEKAWAQAAPAFERAPGPDGVPLLHEQTLCVERDAAHRLLERLAAMAADGGQGEAAAVRRALQDKRLAALAVLEASLTQNGERLWALAREASLDLDVLTALGQLTAWPLLQACGARARPLLAGARWEAGYCPVCAAWPLLSELRGLDSERWLRCGRCGAGWPCLHGRCVYCGNTDHRTQTYLAPEEAREARPAVTCDACQGYLKTLTTFGPIPPDELALNDLTTLELDLAAIERDYGRPAAPGFALRITVAPARATGWLVWRR